MCRHLAYWGPPVPVADLVVRAPHSLLDQCIARPRAVEWLREPRRLGPRLVRADQTAPYRYRTTTPMPLDHDGVAAVDGLEAGRFIAHVRHKSPGAPTDVEGNAPFADGPWLFAHNGFVADYFDGVADAMRAELSPGRRGLPGKADSELLFALVMDRIDAGMDPADAVIDVIGPLSGPAGERGRFNLLLTDGDRLVATRWGNSLHLRAGRGPGAAVVVASEPFDDHPDWEAVPDHTVLHIDANGVELIAH